MGQILTGSQEKQGQGQGQVMGLATSPGLSHPSSTQTPIPTPTPTPDVTVRQSAVEEEEEARPVETAKPASMSPVAKTQQQQPLAPAHDDDDDAGKWQSKINGYRQSLTDFGRIFTYTTWKDRLFLCLSVMAAIGAGAAFPIMTIVYGQLIGKIASVRGVAIQQAQEEFRRLINEYVLYLVYLFIARFVLGYIATLGFRILSLRISSSLRLTYIQALLSLPVSLLDTQPPGRTAAIITTTANTLQIGISEKLALVIQTLSTILSALIVAYAHSWKLTLVTSSGLVLISVCYGVTIPFLVRDMKSVEDANIAASAVAGESLGAVRMVAACGAEGKMEMRFGKFVDEARRRGGRVAWIVAMQQATIYFSVYSTFALAFWFAVRLLMNGEIDNVGTTIIVLMCVMMLAMGVGNIAAPISAAARSAGAARILFNGIDAPRPVTTGLKHPQVSATGDIVLWNVNFTYPTRPNLKVLDNLRLVIPAGKVTAIVGPSGSGKSTIVALVQRWYELDGDNGDRRLILHFRNGSVTVGGHKLTDLHLKWWRSQIGLVQQEPFLFNQTIFENVAAGLIGTEWEDATMSVKEDMVREACKEAFADEFISRLPDGYETPVGDSGAKLSGGQRQRLAIARAIIKKPKILILDEATSSIDVRGEKVVQAALDKVSKNRTTIMIAHRLATVKKADNIVVLAKGKVVQWGTHDKLMKAVGGPYWLLTQSQNLNMGEEDNNQHTAQMDDLFEVVVEEKGTVTLEEEQKGGGEEKEKEKGWKSRGVFRSFGALLMEQEACLHWYVLMLFGALIAGATPAVQAYIFANLIASFAFWGELLRVVTEFWCLMFVGLAAAAGLSYFCLGFASTRVAFHITSVYRLEYFHNMITKPISWFDDPSRSTGTLTGLVATDPTQLQQLLGTNIVFAIISILSVIGCLTISFYFGWKLTLVAFSSAMPLSIAAGFFRIRVEKHFEKMNREVFSESARFATESVGAIRTVTALTLEDRICERYELLLRDHVGKAFGRARFSTVVFAAADSLPLLAMAFVLWYGGTLLITGEYATFNYLVVYIAVIQGAMGAGQWLSFAPNIAQAAAAANRIQAMRVKDQEQTDGPTNDINPELDDEEEEGVRVELRDVWFKYPTRNVPVLRGLNITIEKGQFAAIVGPSGTLLPIKLERTCERLTACYRMFYTPTSGVMTLNNIPISTIPLPSYRNQISLVSQEPALFDGTIRENILLGLTPPPSSTEPTPALDENTQTLLEGTCKSANIHHFITSLPSSYETQIGTRGILLSGGQRQRISIARALIRNPKLLLLDEATSNLDSETEKLVQGVFEKNRRGRTMVVVAHRLATVQNADVIFVVADGRVVEKGGRGELLRRRGVYYGMCQGQALGA
ncbi:ABC transporter-like protein [Poronia punctata]|nr:ABC transporter-like protein [Poronia punctata]